MASNIQLLKWIRTVIISKEYRKIVPEKLIFSENKNTESALTHNESRCIMSR